MKKPRSAYSALFNPRALLAFLLGSLGVFLAIVSFRGMPVSSSPASADRGRIEESGEEREYFIATGGREPKGEELDRQEQEWHNRLTYPTGKFDPAWVRNAARQDSFIPRGVPAGLRNP